MEVHIFVLCCALFAAVAAYSLPDQVAEYSRKDSLLELLESQGCKCINGRCVTDNRGKTKCNCYPGHSLQDESTCAPCDCGEKGRCMFIAHPKSAGGVQYEKKCLCDLGSAEKDGQCIDCQCGENSKCEFEGDEKICYCIDGYSEKEGVCTRCDCGAYGECKFENGQKKCTCDKGYLEHAGYCKECNCGQFGGCTLQNGVKVCSCYQGFSANRGICEKCDCGRNSLACDFKNGAKSCTCKRDGAQYGGQCVDCNCGDQSTGCRFDGNKKVCQCVEGYVQKNTTCRVRCSAFNPCYNGGRCVDGICDCVKGSHGEFCTFIDDCENLCPKDPGIKCALNPLRFERYCKCIDEKLGFHDETRKCRPTCDLNANNAGKSSRICLNGGNCLQKNKGDYSKFCHCLEGTKGDYCQIIPGCLQKNCGTAAKCVYDIDKRAAGCKCHQAGLDFDPKDRTCKRSCEDERKCQNGGKCSSRGDFHFCECLPGTSGDLCEIIDECEKAFDMCKGESRCAFDVAKEKAFCDCPNKRQKYDPLEGKCKYTCNQDAECKNGGLCMHRGDGLFCDCKKGTSGTFCEVVDDCERGACGNRISTVCSFDIKSETVKCGCKDSSLLYDPTTKTCKACDCGRNAVSCSFQQGKKVCVCKNGFAAEDGICRKKWCTEKKCTNGKCEIVDEEEVCTCYEGYVLDGDNCRKLNCKQTPCYNGTCIVRLNNVEHCVCPAGYTLRGGICIRGVCRVGTCFGGKCQVVNGELMCVCPERYDLEGIGCFETVCTKQYCFGGKCVVTKGKEEICTCPKDHVLVGNVCKRVLCEKKNCFGGQCNVVHGEEVCTCPPGFVLFKDVCREVQRRGN